MTSGALGQGLIVATAYVFLHFTSWSYATDHFSRRYKADDSSSLSPLHFLHSLLLRQFIISPVIWVAGPLFRLHSGWALGPCRVIVDNVAAAATTHDDGVLMLRNDEAVVCSRREPKSRSLGLNQLLLEANVNVISLRFSYSCFVVVHIPLEIDDYALIFKM